MSKEQPNQKTFLQFPAGFLWGCAAAPTNVEGQTFNEWADFTANDDSSPDDGPHHWQHYRYDFKNMAALNLNAYCLGFDWARLQHDAQAPLEREIKLRYQEMLAELRGYNIEPLLCLFHHACPRWFAKLGGWLNPDAPQLFADFVRRVTVFTDGAVKYFLPFYETAYHAFAAYVAGITPPFKKGRVRLFSQALQNMRRAQALCYAEIKNYLPDAQVGAGNQLKNVLPFRYWHPLDRLMTTSIKRYYSPKTFYGLTELEDKKIADFLSVTYHGKARMHGMTPLTPRHFDSQALKQAQGIFDDDSEQDPANLPEILKELYTRHQLPVFLAGHRVNTENENLRSRLIKEHLQGLHQAMADGVPVKGYFYWSLLDTFEYVDGLQQNCGLLNVVFEDPNRRRDLRRAACEYAQIAKNNGFAPPPR